MGTYFGKHFLANNQFPFSNRLCKYSNDLNEMKNICSSEVKGDFYRIWFWFRPVGRFSSLRHHPSFNRPKIDINTNTPSLFSNDSGVITTFCSFFYLNLASNFAVISLSNHVHFRLGTFPLVRFRPTEARWKFGWPECSRPDHHQLSKSRPDSRPL